MQKKKGQKWDTKNKKIKNKYYEIMKQNERNNE